MDSRPNRLLQQRRSDRSRGLAGEAEDAPRGKITRVSTVPAAAPRHWARTKAAAEAGAMPENVSVNTRPRVTAGFANDVELVNQ